MPDSFVAPDRNKLNRRFVILGRLILDIQREKAGAEFTTTDKAYPDRETLRKLGLSALGELHSPELLEIVQEAARRDTGVKQLINRILSSVQTQSQPSDVSEPAEEPSQENE